MRVGFLNNQIDNRGTGNALYDYADYNEKILGNESLIFTLGGPNNSGMLSKLTERFGAVWGIGTLLDGRLGVDAIYHIKSGENDGSLVLPDTLYAVHAVFNGSQRHGDRYATISEWMGNKYGIPFVPHIVDLPPPTSDLRVRLNIPRKAKVFGRYGGPDTFDIPFVWTAIYRALQANPLIYFLFMNTDKPPVDFYDERRVIFLPETSNQFEKSSFVYACDAMIHARGRGETFGIACGEFAIADKPVITYEFSGERAHLEQLGDLAIPYQDRYDLFEILTEYPLESIFPGKNKYREYTPEKVMAKFKAVFLDEGD